VSSNPLLDHVRALLTERVDSVAQLELLLFMYHHRDRAWSPGEAAAELRISPEWTSDQLDLLARRGLLASFDHGFRYATTPELDRAVADLAHAYRTFPVTVVSAIYAGSNRTLTNFADAFRLRRPPEHPEKGAPPG
jgi:hypothetical protein